jgi:hypothetical protein
LTVDFESSFAALAIEASRLAIPEAFWKAVSGMFEKLKTTWTTGSDADGGFSDGAAGFTEAFADTEGEGIKVGVGLGIVKQIIESSVVEHVPPP